MIDKKIGYLILNYNTWKDTINEIENIHECLSAKYSDIVVVDNCSQNESKIKLLEYSNEKKIVFIEADQNNGYASGNNIGLRYFRKMGYDYVWIMNNDIRLADKELNHKVMEVFSKCPGVAVINPEIILRNHEFANRESIRPTWYDLSFGCITYRKKGREVLDEGGYAYIYRPQGCCMIVDIKKVEEVDFFDEYTFLYCEESILAEKLLKKQYKCVCLLNSTVFHDHSKTVKSTLDKRKILKINEISFKYYLKEYRKFTFFQIQVCVFFNRLKMMLF